MCILNNECSEDFSGGSVVNALPSNAGECRFDP